MMVVNSEGYVPLSQPRNTRAVEKKTLAPHSWRTRLRVPRRLSSRRLEFGHFCKVVIDEYDRFMFHYIR